jgi:serine/threonine protein phosphatase PrpC
MENNILEQLKQLGITATESQIVEFIKSQEVIFGDFLKSFLQEKSTETSEQEEVKSESVENSTSDSPSENTELLVASETSDSPISSDSLQTAPPETPAEKSVTEIQQENKQGEAPASALSAKEKEEKVENEKLAFEIKNRQITFQNGKVNQEYSVDFDFENLKMPEITEVSFEGLENIGLQYFPDKKKIAGKPILAGDHKIEMKFRRKDWTEGKPLLTREVLFIINPDPRDLWSKNIPTPEDVEYYKPDCDKRFVKVVSKKESKFLGLKKTEIARKDMVAASQRGRSHAIEGKPRDDDFALYFDEETEWYVMVVADGAGSAPFSRKGSQIACQTAIEICKSKITEKKEELEKLTTSEQKNEVGKILQEIISNAVFSAHKAIETEAKEKERPSKNYATTLLVSLCKKFEYGWFIGAWWVGDGGIAVYRKEPEYLKVLGEPDGGEFAGQTRFLTMQEIIQNELYTRIRFDVVEDFTALILMSDGVTDPKFETDANLNRIEKWHALWDDLNGKNEDGAKVAFTDDNEQSADQLLKWLDFWSKGNHDDRTIAILF